MQIVTKKQAKVKSDFRIDRNLKNDIVKQAKQRGTSYANYCREAIAIGHDILKGGDK